MNLGRTIPTLLLVFIASVAGWAQAVHSQSWEIKELVYQVVEQWVESDPLVPNPNHPDGRDVQAGHLEILSGPELKEKKKIESGIEGLWSPDGQKVAFLGFCDGAITCNEIWTADADGSARRIVTNPSASANGRSGQAQQVLFSHMVDSFSWSPKGEKIAYVDTGPPGGKIVIIKEDGSGRVEVPKHESEGCKAGEVRSAPVWSPDGNNIAFTACDQREPVVVVVREDGEDEHKVVKGYGAIWSPNGEQLVFRHTVAGKNPVTSIWVSDANGNEPKKVLTDESAEDGLKWLPNGSSIAFASRRDNKHQSEIFRINIDGTGLEKLASGKSEGWSFSSPTFSPDGTQLLVVGASYEPPPQQRRWSDSDRLSIVLIDLISGKRQRIAGGDNPSVVWQVR